MKEVFGTSSEIDLQMAIGLLEENNIKTLSAEVAMVPKNYTKLEDEEQIKKFEKMLEMFDDNDDVQDVYHNAELPDDYE